MADRIISRPGSEAYRSNFDVAFRRERPKYLDDLVRLLDGGVLLPVELERRIVCPDAERIQNARNNWPWPEKPNWPVGRMREPGFYWVRFIHPPSKLASSKLASSKWTVAEYNAESNGWNVLGDEWMCSDAVFEEIGPRLLPPGEEPTK